jgi:transforming growth factor-beta-induced protein
VRIVHYHVVTDVILHHTVPHVVCSAIVESRLWTRNKLGSALNLTRHTDGGSDTVRVNTAELLVSDVMATNGALHIIDEVLIPNEGN